MQWVRLLSATLILAGLGGAIWWSNKHDAKEEVSASAVPGMPTAPKKVPGPTIIAVNEPDVRGIEVAHADEPAVVATSESPGVWRISAPQTLAADSPAFIGMIAAATHLTSERVIDDKIGADENALKSYGLNPPLTAVKFVMKDGSTKRLRVGEDTPDGAGAYSVVDGDARLFTMLASQKALFDKHLGDLREKHLLKFRPDELTRLELNVPGKPAIQFDKTADRWLMAKPIAARADSTQVEELIRKLGEAQMLTDAPAPAPAPRGKGRPPAAPAVFDEQKSSAAFTAGHPVAVAKLTTGQGVMNFEVRKSGMDYFGRASGPNSTPGTFKVSAELGDGLNKTAADFRNKKLFDFGFNDPSRIEYSYMGQSRVFEKSGETWTSDSRQMDTLAMQNFLDKLRDLAASRTDDGHAAAPQKGNSTMELSITSLPSTVTTTLGKSEPPKAKSEPRVEKVHISPSGTEFSGRRDRDTTGYILDAATVTALSEAVNGVRESQPAPKK